MRAALTLGMRWGAGFAAVALLLGAIWGAGFVAFDWAARRPGPSAPGPWGTADGIVALTGGVARVDTALALLAAGRAPILLISGVGRATDLAELERKVQLSPDQSARVSLGRMATSTRGNAEETAEWARAHGVHSLLVVTAGYHMPRALIEIGRALPGLRLYPVRVQPPALRGGVEAETLRMLANEFDKLLAVSLGLPWRGLDLRKEQGGAGQPRTRDGAVARNEAPVEDRGPGYLKAASP